MKWRVYMKPAITIIIPVYNVENYIHKSIESILSQTLSNIEIILVDDGSTDKSGEIADFYAKKDLRIKVIHQKNHGVSISRNVGLELAIGEYIAFIDPDDWVDDDMFEKLYCEAIQNNCDVVMCGFSKEYIKSNKSVKVFHLFQSNTVLLKDYIKKEICSQLLKHGFFTSVCDKIYRRSFLEKYKIRMYNDIQLREDYLFNMDIFNFAERAIYLPMPFYHYRIITNSAITKYHKNRFQFDLKIYNEKKEYAKKWFPDNQKYLKIVSYDFLLDVYYNVIKVYNKNNLENIKNKYKHICEIINHSDTRQALLQCEKFVSAKDIINYIKIKLIKNKCIFILNAISLFGNTFKNIKRKIQVIIRID